LVEPGGSLDTTAARYHAITDRAVRVEGGRFVPAEKYTVRIEGASLAGYRSIVIAGIRDPLVLRQLDSFLASLRATVEQKIAHNLAPPPESYTLNFRVYGRDGTMGALESDLLIEGHEIGLIIDVVASSQELASDILPLVWHSGLHHPIPEYQGLVSNFAFPFSPPGLDAGPVYRFCCNHVWEIDNPCEPFHTSWEEL
jgi:hypothetical protein